MTVEKLLTAWRLEPTVGGSVVEWRILPARDAHISPLPDDLHPRLAAALRSSGIETLYTHQAAAWERIQAGENVVVVTGTASGKTLCYNLPILDRLLREPASTALYLFPTKALAQDQSTGLHELVEAISHPSPHENGILPSQIEPASKIPLAIYDGDTPSQQRQAIRSQARLLLTNPDMLHIGILPHHTRWMSFFQSLRYVVIDEIHTYRGVFGSHVANVIRRLKRIARYYGAQPQFILTSATIANPGEFAHRLVEAPISVLDEDGSKRGSKHFLIYNPPVIDRDLGLRRSALQESVRLAEDLLAYGVQSIIFARSRRTVEIILTYLREKAASISPIDTRSATSTAGSHVPVAQRGESKNRSSRSPKPKMSSGLHSGKSFLRLLVNSVICRHLLRSFILSAFVILRSASVRLESKHRANRNVATTSATWL